MAILIVAEEPSDRLLLRLTLEPLGTEIQDVASGQEALEGARLR